MFLFIQVPCEGRCGKNALCKNGACVCTTGCAGDPYTRCFYVQWYIFICFNLKKKAHDFIKKNCNNFCTIMRFFFVFFFIKCVWSVYKYLLQENNIKKRLTSCHKNYKVRQRVCLDRPMFVLPLAHCIIGWPNLVQKIYITFHGMFPSMLSNKYPYKRALYEYIAE